MGRVSKIVTRRRWGWGDKRRKLVHHSVTVYLNVVNMEDSSSERIQNLVGLTSLCPLFKKKSAPFKL